MAKNLIVYYSHSGTTEKIAKMLAQKTSADIYEIRRSCSIGNCSSNRSSCYENSNK